MLGAIIGDMYGSPFEGRKCNEPKLYINEMRMTDDSYLTIAVADVLMKHYPIEYSEDSLNIIKDDLRKAFIKTFIKHRNAGFGHGFYNWCSKYLIECKTEPYNSYGNGSAMRISPVGWIGKTEEEIKILSKTVSEITHNHPEGIKGAEAIAMCIFLAKKGISKEDIKRRMVEDYYPEIETLSFDQLVREYKFNSKCQESVPQAIYCFLLGNNFQDVLTKCCAIGGDTDTICAMAGSIAEAYYNKYQLSEFEKEFIYLKIDPSVEEQIINFHKTIGSRKFEKASEYLSIYEMMERVINDDLKVVINTKYFDNKQTLKETLNRYFPNNCNKRILEDSLFSNKDFNRTIAIDKKGYGLMSLKMAHLGGYYKYSNGKLYRL